LSEKSHGSAESVPAKPAKSLLSAMREEHYSENKSQGGLCDIAYVGSHQSCEHAFLLSKPEGFRDDEADSLPRTISELCSGAKRNRWADEAGLFVGGASSYCFSFGRS
jgi:hypothetical protein